MHQNENVTDFFIKLLRSLVFYITNQQPLVQQPISCKMTRLVLAVYAYVMWQ